jgi:hypothetical protein
MPDYSIKLPHVTDVAITTAKELLAFATLPYYQASGNLKSGEGAVAIGDPIAWDSTAKKYLKYVAGVGVTDEALGTGDSTQQVFKLANTPVKSPITNVKVNAVTKTEGTDFVVDYKRGLIFFLLGAIPGAVAVTASYTHYNGDAYKAVGFVRIPGDSTSADVAIEALIGGAVKYSVVSAATAWNAQILADLGAIYWEIADAVIW